MWRSFLALTPILNEYISTVRERAYEIQNVSILPIEIR